MPSTKGVRQAGPLFLRNTNLIEDKANEALRPWSGLPKSSQIDRWKRLSHLAGVSGNYEAKR